MLEKLTAADEELVRAVEARLQEGDVAPLDVNLVRVESDRLKVQAISARSELQTQILNLKTLTGADVAESLRLAPQPDRPPRLDLGLNELTELALNGRTDLQAARLGEQIGAARIDLAKSNSVPNVAGSVRYTRNKQIIDFPPSPQQIFQARLFANRCGQLRRRSCFKRLKHQEKSARRRSRAN